MAASDDMVVKISAEVSGLQRELKKATDVIAKSMAAQAKEVEKLDRQLSMLNATASKVAGYFGGPLKAAVQGFIAGFALNAIIGRVQATLDWASATAKLARMLDVNVESLQEFQGAAKKGGVDAETFAAGMTRLQTILAQANSGKGKGADAFTALQISLKNADGSAKDLFDTLLEVSARIQAFDRQSQIAIAKELFPDDPIKWLNFLKQGPDAIRANADAFRDAGLVAQKELIDKAAGLNKSMKESSEVIDTKFRNALLGAAPILEEMRNFAKLMLTDLLEFLGTAKGIDWRMGPAPEGAPKPTGGQTGPFAGSSDTFKGLGSALTKASKGIVGEGTRKYDPEAAKKGAAQGETFRKLMEDMKAEGEKLATVLDPYKAALADLDGKLKKLQTTDQQTAQAHAQLKKNWDDKAVAELAKYGEETDHLRALAAAEAAGNRELVATLEAEWQMRKLLGPTLADQYKQQTDALALARLKIEDAREQTRQFKADLEGGIRQAFDGLTSSLLDFSQTNETVWERMRKLGLSVIDQLLKKMMELAILNPLLNSLGLNGGKPLSTFGSLFQGSGISTGIGNSITEGGGLGSLFSGLSLFADGGRPPVGVPSIVGEKGPELFIPDVAGTVVPNGARMGGGTINLYGSNDSMVRVGQLESALQSLGMRVNRIDGSIEHRAITATIDARRRGGVAAAY